MLNPNAEPYQYKKKMIHIMSPSAYSYHKATPPLPPPVQLFHPLYLKPSLPLPPPQLFNHLYQKQLLYYPPLPSFRPPPPPPLQYEHQQPPLQHEQEQSPLHEVSPKTQEYYCMMEKINKNKKKAGRIMTKPKNAPSSSLTFANSSSSHKRRSSLTIPYFCPGSRFVPRGPRQYQVQMIEDNHGSSSSNNKYSSSQHNTKGLVLNHTSSGTGVYLSRPAANKKTTTKTTATTTSSSVMMRNIPNGLSRKMLMDIVDQHCIDENNKALRMLNHSYHQDTSSPSELTISEYDFLYLPVDFVSKGNLGYAFLNFTTCVAAMRFYKAFDNYSWKRSIIKSPKICKICPARIQGKDGLVERFKHSYFQCETDEFLPVSFSPPRDGYTSRSLPSLIGKRPKTSRKRIHRTCF